ncbi:MAG: response regulator [Acidobacteria bacterium]|nr:response regulator [Acidobacteriota bacterium]
MTEKFPPLRVLIVDDELLIRWSIAETLSLAGHSVVQAADGAGAIAALTPPNAPIDAIVLDYRLPDSDDFRLLERVRALAPASPVVLVTAHGSAEIDSGALARGVYAIVKKPFDVNELTGLLSRACSR